MAQLKDSVIDGSLVTTGDVTIQNEKSIQSIHPETGDASKLLHMSQFGNTIVGYDGYINQNGNSHIYGNDIVNYVASAGNSNFRPYYRAGDSISFKVRTAGYVTSSGTQVSFIVPITKPVIGSPTATATSNSGFVLRQGNNYTHGSAASTYATPTNYTVDTNYNSGFIVTAVFDVTTNVTNNDAIGVYWDGTITLS